MNRDTALPSIKNPPPGPYAKEWTRYHMALATKGIYFHNFVWDRSRPAIGPFCSDPDGNLILDFSSHGLAFPLGYNNPELIEMASRAAEVNPDRYGAEIVAAWGTDPGQIDVPTPSHLIHKLAAVTGQFGLDRFFLSNSGAEAVENALKICYAHRKNMGIAFGFQRAFHGRTLGATSLTKSRRAQSAWYPPVPQTVELPYCHCSEECHCGWRVSPVLYREEDFVSRVKEITQDRGVDAVYDSVGRATFMKSLDCLRPLGTIVSFGQASGPVPPLDIGILAAKGSLFLTRPSLMAYTAKRDDLLAHAQDLFAVVEKGAVKIEIRQTYPLAEAVQAHRDLEGRKTTDSSLLIPE